MDHVEQRMCLRFCVLNGITCTNALKMLQNSYGNRAMSKTQVYTWYKYFKEGRIDVNDNSRCGRPPTATNEANIKKVKDILLENPQVNQRELARMVGISYGSVHSILVNVLHIRPEVGKKQKRRKDPVKSSDKKQERNKVDSKA